MDNLALVWELETGGYAEFELGIVPPLLQKFFLGGMDVWFWI